MECPLSYAISPTGQWVHVIYHEQPSFTQWSQTMAQILADPAYQLQTGVLLDRRTVLRPADTEYIKQMVNFIDRRQAVGWPSHWAILVGDPGSYGMGRMAEQLSDHSGSIRAFRELAEAIAWLTSFHGNPGQTPDSHRRMPGIPSDSRN